MNVLRKIFGGIYRVIIKPVASRLKVAFLEGKLLELISTSSVNFFQAVAGVGLSYIFLKTILKKMLVKPAKTVIEQASADKDSVIDAVTESINRDQDIDQDIARYGYTEKELAKNPEVKEMVDKFNSERVLGGSMSRKSDKHKEAKTFKAVDDHGCLVFLRRMKEGETKEDVTNILKDLIRRGWIGGPWATNPYKAKIANLYG